MYTRFRIFFTSCWIVLFSYSHAQYEFSDASLPLIITRSEEKLDVYDALHFFEQKEAVIRFAEVSLNPALKSVETVKAGNGITLDLFEDVFYTAVVSRTNKNINGTTSVTATVKETAGYVVFAHHGSRSLATIYLPSEGMYYKIISDPITLVHYIIEMDARDRDVLEGGPPIIPEIRKEDIEDQKRIREHLKNQNLGPDDWANVDVMVLFTENAEIWASVNGGGIENVVALAMANAQLVLDNSQTKMTMTLVNSGFYDFSETGNTSNDLATFAQSDYLHDLRNLHNADLVSVFARVNDVGGIAYLLNSRLGIPEIGYSVVRVQQAAEGYTPIHEMGHNMGCHHHWQQNFQPGPTNWSNWPENRWSGGWRWQGNDGEFYCSVMTYTSGNYYDDGVTHTEVPYFSNPEVSFMESSTGDSHLGNNALTLREVKHVIASYRISELATIFTTPITEVGFTNAFSGGEITNDGGTPIIERGVIWSTDPNPTLEDYQGISKDGDGTGVFVSEIKDLQPSTNYFVVAYAITNTGVSYGVQRTFQTKIATLANVKTGELFSVSYNSARAGGNVIDTGNSDVSSRGFVWGTESRPSVNNNLGFTIDGEGSGPFESIITGLEPETEYYFRAYATNLGGTVYGNTYTFTTLFAKVYPNPFTDRIFVEFKNESHNVVYIVVTNTRGQVVSKVPVSEHGDVKRTISVENLEGGIYLLTVESEFEFPVWQMLKLGR